jgi:hypothetical protein
MPTEASSNVKFEIGHVLFIDIVGYSKLLIIDQSERLQRLKEIVWGTEQFRLAQAEGKLLRLPTGDGGALVFRNNPEAPVLCAMEILGGSGRGMIGSPLNIAFAYAYLFCRVAIFLRKPSTATKPIAKRPNVEPTSGTAVVTTVRLYVKSWPVP